MPRPRKSGEKVAIGAMCVAVSHDIDASGNQYDVLTSAELSKLSFFPKVRGISPVNRCMLFVWDLFEDPNGSQLSTYLNMWIMTLIVLSAVVGACIETNPPIHKEQMHQEDVWFAIETFFIANFSVEFLCRVSCCPSCADFWKQGMNYVDVIAILPYYLKLIIGGGVNIGFLRCLRLGRAVRLVKMGRYSQGIRLVSNALSKSMDALQLFFFLLVLVLVVFSSGVYYFERGTWDSSKGKYYRDDPVSGVQESTPSPFQSIPQSFWWCIVTLTTVGYGDMYPYTPLGKLFTVLTMLVGLVMLALPLSIIGTNFIEERNVMVAENEYKVTKQQGSPLPRSYKLQGCIQHCLKHLRTTKHDVDKLDTTVQELLVLLESILLQNDHSSQDQQEDTLKQKEDPSSSPTDAAHQIRVSTQGERNDNCRISNSQMQQLLDLQLDILTMCVVLEHIWADGGDNLEHLPNHVRELISPRVHAIIRSDPAKYE